MERYRIGIAGAGFGASAHLPALVAHPRFEVVALASPNNARAIASERGIPASFRSCRDMLAHCELDAVTVASPPEFHRDDVLAVLEAGRHVMCEKPFALDLASARAMLDAAERAGAARACGIAHEFRFVPQAQAIRELIVNGHLDPLRDLEIALYSPRLRGEVATQRRWWFERERGGGIAGASLSHLIDMANWLTGRPPERAFGLLRTANPLRHDDRGTFTSTVDDGAFALIEYSDGIVARLASDSTLAMQSYLCAAHAENRTAVFSGPSIVEGSLFSVDGDETAELACKPSPHASFTAVNPNVPYLMDLYDEFAKAIAGQPNGLPTFAQAMRTQEVLAAIGYAPAEPPSVR